MLDLLAECPSTRLVLGLREVLDQPSTVRQEWAHADVSRKYTVV